MLRDLMSDAMEEVDLQQTATSTQAQANGRTGQVFLPGSTGATLEAYVICLLIKSAVSNLLKKRQVQVWVDIY